MKFEVFLRKIFSRFSSVARPVYFSDFLVAAIRLASPRPLFHFFFILVAAAAQRFWRNPSHLIRIFYRRWIFFGEGDLLAFLIRKAESKGNK